MIPILFAAALAAAPAGDPALKDLRDLEGCWSAPGEVRGKATKNRVRGAWRVGDKFMVIQLNSTDDKDPYAAEIPIGAGEKPGELVSYWMDSTGGAFSTSGKGRLEADGFTLTYHYPEADYVNVWRRAGKGWRWTITETAPGKPSREFAHYDLLPSGCSIRDR
jgi:hypothetical protein